MSEELLSAINAQLHYGDSRAEWIREACRQRLARETTGSEQRDELAES